MEKFTCIAGLLAWDGEECEAEAEGAGKCRAKGEEGVVSVRRVISV